MAPARSARKTAMAVVSQTTEFKTFDQYTAEADLPPFELPVSEEETLLFRCPSADDMKVIAHAQLTQNFDLMVTGACGEHAERMWELVGDKPFPVIRSIVKDLMDHFVRELENLPES